MIEPHILVVEDDPIIGRSLARGLQHYGYRATQVSNGRLRTALDELIDHGFLQKEAGRGRQPNTYSLLKTTTPSKGKERNTPMSP